MKNAISFHNPGLIDVRAITTMGVSSKDTDTPIGYFGTGLKYAIAIILRNQGGVTIWRGLEPLHFGTAECRVRNDDFSIVTMNNHELGFTTLLGQNWTLWQAFREFYCNALDEGGALVEGVQPPKEGSTTIVVYGCSELDDLYRQRSTIYLESTPIAKDDRCEIHREPSDWYFYQGVRLDQVNDYCNYTYNFTKTLDLTEDRSVKYSHVPLGYIADLILTCDDAGFIREWLTQKSDPAKGKWAGSKPFENMMNLSWASRPPSATFLDVVSNLRNANEVEFNLSALEVLERSRPEKINPSNTVTLTKVEQVTLEKAIKFLQVLGYDVTIWPIVVVENMSPGVLARAVDDTIIISRRAFMQGGTKMIAATLLEEHIHLKLKLKDYTVNMQNYLFEKIISLGEELVGEPL